MEKEPKPTFGVGDFYDFMESNVPFIECVKGRFKTAEWVSEWGVARACMGGGECSIVITDDHTVFDMRWNTQFDGMIVVYDHGPYGSCAQRQAEDKDWRIVSAVLAAYSNQIV